MNTKYTLYNIVMLITSIYEFIIVNIRVLATLTSYQSILGTSIHRLTSLNVQTQGMYRDAQKYSVTVIIYYIFHIKP
jgi:hypothetical protein